MLLNKIGLFFFKFLITVFRFLPLSWVLGLSNGLTFLLGRVFRYRRQVILTNLKIVFPKKNPQQLQQLTAKIYQALADNLTLTIKSFTMSEETIQSRITCSNPELLEKHLQQGQSILLVGGHFYPWELAVQAFPLYVQHPAYGVYKPLSNALVGDHLNTLRNRFGSIPISMNQTLRTIIKNKKIPSIFVFIADQSPSNVKNAHWIYFFRKETGFLQGVDKIARATNYPVLYYTIHSTKRGFYTLTFTELVDAPKSTSEGSVTLAFAKKLEETILEDPIGWLWSHKRWKRQIPKNAKILPND